MQKKTYIAIDLKSFYASVECVERGKDPMTTCLVLADPSRTEKTICLAVSPALKAYGISGRAPDTAWHRSSPHLLNRHAYPPAQNISDTPDKSAWRLPYSGPSEAAQ